MNWINKYFKIFSYNISILLLIFLFISFITIIFNRFSNSVSEDNRFNLINYKNIDWAKTHFKEFSKLNANIKTFMAGEEVILKVKQLQLTKMA